LWVGCLSPWCAVRSDLISCWATVRSSGACAVWTRAAVAACPRRGCSRQRLRRRALVSARGARRRRGGHRGAAGRRRGRGGRRAGRAQGRPPRPRSWRRAGWSAATRRWWLPSATAGAPVRRRAPWIVWGMVMARHRGWPFGWNCAASRACAHRMVVNPARAKARSECGLWSERVCVTCGASPEA